MAFVRPITRLKAQSSSVVGASQRTVTGTGVAAAQDALVAGFSARVVDGTGVLTSGPATVAGSGLGSLTISTIPNLTLAVGETHDMSQYINNPEGEVIETAVTGLLGFASYNPETRLLTGVAEGAESSLQYEVTTYPHLSARSDTFHSIGIIWELLTAEDTDNNAVVSVEYRQVGAGSWSNASDLLRIDDYTAYFTGSQPQGDYPYNRFNGSIMFLTPGTQYYVRLTYTDPDGTDPADGTVVTFQTTTRAIPVKPAGNTYYADPNATGPLYDGSTGDPFQTLEQADNVVSPGDTVKLRSGTYSQVLTTFNNGGSAAGGHVLYGPDGAATPVLYRHRIAADYLWFDNLTFTGVDTVTNIDASESLNSALYSINQNTDTVVTGCSFTLFTRGIALRGCPRSTVMDNTGVGPNLSSIGSDSWLVRTGGEGSANGPGSVIAYNKASEYSDNINAGADSDVYGNDSFAATDDTFSSDGEESNVRVWGNRFTDWDLYTLPLQPQTCGPWYFMYNQCISASQPFKWKWPDRNVFVGNTFIVGGMGQTARHYLRMTFKNNLCYRDASSTVMSGTFKADDLPEGDRGSQLEPDWNSDVDHNGYGNISGNLVFYAGTNYSLSGYIAAVNAVAIGGVTVEENSVVITASRWTNLVGRDETTHLDLAASDGDGVFIDNLADWHGPSPDMGYRQFGEAELQFGPRSGELGDALASRTDNWSKH